MSRESRPMAAPSGNGEVTGTDELRAEIEQTRRDLGDTVEALAAKADVRARAKEMSDRVRADMSVRGQRMAKNVAKNAREMPKAPVIAVGATGLAAAGAFVVLRIRSRRSGKPMWTPPKMPRKKPGRSSRGSSRQLSWEKVAARCGR